MEDRLPIWADLALSAPPWTLGLSAFALAGFMMWLNWPRKDVPGPQTRTESDISVQSISDMFGPEIAKRRFRLADWVSNLEAKSSIGLNSTLSDFEGFVSELHAPNPGLDIICSRGHAKQKWCDFEASARKYARAYVFQPVDDTVEAKADLFAHRHKMRSELRSATSRLIAEIVPVS